MYDPLAWTASTTCGMEVRRVVVVAVNETHLLPGLDLGISVNVRSMVIRPSGRVDGAGLGYQK